MDCGPSDSSVHGFPRQEHWGGLPFLTPWCIPNPGIEICISCIDRQILYHWATREALLYSWLGIITASEKRGKGRKTEGRGLRKEQEQEQDDGKIRIRAERCKNHIDEYFEPHLSHFIMGGSMIQYNIWVAVERYFLTWVSNFTSLNFSFHADKMTLHDHKHQKIVLWVKLMGFFKVLYFSKNVKKNFKKMETILKSCLYTF